MVCCDSGKTFIRDLLWREWETNEDSACVYRTLMTLLTKISAHEMLRLFLFPCALGFTAFDYLDHRKFDSIRDAVTKLLADAVLTEYRKQPDALGDLVLPIDTGVTLCPFPSWHLQNLPVVPTSAPTKSLFKRRFKCKNCTSSVSDGSEDYIDQMKAGARCKRRRYNECQCKYESCAVEPTRVTLLPAQVEDDLVKYFSLHQQTSSNTFDSIEAAEAWSQLPSSNIANHEQVSTTENAELLNGGFFPLACGTSDVSQQFNHSTQHTSIQKFTSMSSLSVAPPHSAAHSTPSGRGLMTNAPSRSRQNQAVQLFSSHPNISVTPLSYTPTVGPSDVPKQEQVKSSGTLCPTRTKPTSMVALSCPTKSNPSAAASTRNVSSTHQHMAQMVTTWPTCASL